MKKNLMILAALLTLAFDRDTLAIDITNVEVIPVQPSSTNSITFSISGISGSSPTSVVYDLFSQNGVSLQLDLYLNRGFLPAVSSWDYSKQIQPLVPAIYNLEIRAFNNDSGILEDTYNLGFTVVPEPATIALLSLGMPFLRVFSARRQKI